MKHSFIDRYADLDSPLHLLEARTKIIGFTALIIAALQIPPGKPLLFIAYFFLAAMFMGISQIPLAYVVGRALIILPFVLLAGISAPWKGAGMPAFGVVLMRSLLCLILLVLLTNTTRFAELLRGLRRLGCPRILIVNLSFLYRYLFVLIEEVMRMRQARDCRRFGRAPVKAEIRLLGSMLGTVLLRSFERAERMYQAMLSRGSSGEIPILAARKFTWRDLAFLAGLAGFVFIVS
jgi:cobalt/nickel transport system permease protein